MAVAIEVQNLLYSNLLSENVKFEIYSTIHLSVDLCRCETWSLTLRQEHRLRVFENSVLKSIFGPEVDKVVDKWKRLHSADLHGMCCSPNVIRVILSRSVMVHVARIGGGGGGGDCIQ
jgi:hypothetical protein